MPGAFLVVLVAAVLMAILMRAAHRTGRREGLDSAAEHARRWAFETEKAEISPALTEVARGEEARRRVIAATAARSVALELEELAG